LHAGYKLSARNQARNEARSVGGRSGFESVARCGLRGRFRGVCPFRPAASSTWRSALRPSGSSCGSLRPFPATHSQPLDWVAGKWLFL